MQEGIFNEENLRSCEKVVLSLYVASGEDDDNRVLNWSGAIERLPKERKEGERWSVSIALNIVPESTHLPKMSIWTMNAQTQFASATSQLS